MKITQSILSSFDTCPLSAQYKVHPPEWARKVCKAGSSMGTGYHAGLERHYRARIAREFMPVETMIAAGHAAFDRQLEVDQYDGKPVDEFRWDAVADRDEAHAMIATLLRAHVEGGHLLDARFEILDVETNVTVDIGNGVEVKLGADILARDTADGALVLEDHKTAAKAWDQTKHDPRKNGQAALYTEIVRRLHPGKPGYRFQFGIMQYPTKTLPARFDRRVVSPTAEHGAAVINKAHLVADLITQAHEGMWELPANTSSNLCSAKWCEFYAGCPYGARLDGSTSLASLIAPKASPPVAALVEDAEANELLEAMAENRPPKIATEVPLTSAAPQPAGPVDLKALLAAAASPAPPAEAPPVAPVAPAPRRTFDQAPTPTRPSPPAEGPDAPKADQDRFLVAWGRCDAAAKAWVKVLAEQGHAAGRAFSVSAKPSVRRVDIGLALTSLVATKNDDDEVLARLLAVAIGEDLQPAIPLGAVLGALTIEQAARLLELANALGGGALALQFDLDGVLTLIGPALVGS